TGVIDANGTRYASYSYEQWGRPTTTQHGTADLYGVTFNDTTNARVVSGPLGLQETYTFAMVQLARKVTRSDRVHAGRVLDLQLRRQRLSQQHARLERRGHQPHQRRARLAAQCHTVEFSQNFRRFLDDFIAATRVVGCAPRRVRS